MKTESKGRSEQREAERRAKVAAGIEKLDLWLDDLVRSGFARLEREPEDFAQQARRLVDAQARSLARRVKGLENVLDGRPDWPERLLEDLGRIALLTHAWKRLDDLPEALRDDVRGRIGWEMRRADVFARGERVRDVWTPFAATTEAVDTHLRLRRTWLQGRESQRDALLLHFAGGSKGSFPETPPLGRAFTAQLVFSPSAYPLRAEIVEQDDGQDDELLAGQVSTFPTLDAFLDTAAEAAARLPWIELLPCRLSGIVPVAPRGEHQKWWLVDSRGDALPCSPSCSIDALHKLLAISGGHPLDLFGEWDGRCLRPLAVYVDGGFQGLTQELSS